MLLKAVQPCFRYGHINNVKPDLDLYPEKDHYGKGQGHYPYSILTYVTIYSFFPSFIELNLTIPEIKSKVSFVRQNT